MKLEKILDQLNSFEKNSFLKIITNIIENSPQKEKKIENVLSASERDLKNADNINIAKVVDIIKDEFSSHINSEHVKATSQLDILIDILIRDGNCIMSRDWFSTLYKSEISSFKKKIIKFKADMQSEKSEFSERRKRDYKIFQNCLRIAYYNDEKNNLECKVTSDEQSILNTLAKSLGLSQEEIKLINYSTINIIILDVDNLINDLKNLGIIFYLKKKPTIYVADEIVRILRKVRGKEIADKYFRRVLRQFREPQLNLIARNHNINWKSPREVKIKGIIKEGIGISDVLMNDIFKEGTKVSEKKTFFNELVGKHLNITQPRGVTLEEKIENLINYFDKVDKDEKVGISIDGYEQLLVDLGNIIPETRKLIKTEFELQQDEVLKSNYLLDYNIKPRDVLDLISGENLKKLCEKKSIKTRGDIVTNILRKYKDSVNLFIENYNNIAYRNINELKANGLNVKEAELGIKFEEITKSIFKKLGFNVDETLRKKLNTAKNKIDIILNIGDKALFVIECKTSKESGFNKFSSVSRQIKSYIELAHHNGYRVIKTLLIAPEFGEDFEKECREEFELNLSLIKAETLVAILNGLKNSKHKELPYKLLMKDVLIKEDWILKAINK